MSSFISVILYLVLAPFVGGLLEGADRIITNYPDRALKLLERYGV